MSRLKGKRFWLVGASTGIGRQLAIQLADAGAAVVVSARNVTALESLMSAMVPVQSNNGGHAVVYCDVSDSEQTTQAYQQTGGVDGVIYCAGAYEPMSAIQPDIKTIETIVDVNLTGALRVLASCVPDFSSKNRGHVLIIGSISGYRGLPDAWGYGASKAGVMHLAENLRCDLRHKRILVQICNPGFVSTRLTDKNNFRMPFLMKAEEAARKIVQGMERGRFEIAFPFPLVSILKLLAALPLPLYFGLLKLFGRGSGKQI